MRLYFTELHLSHTHLDMEMELMAQWGPVSPDYGTVFEAERAWPYSDYSRQFIVVKNWFLSQSNSSVGESTAKSIVNQTYTGKFP